MSMLVRVKLITRMAGAKGNFSPGEEIYVNQALADALVLAGSAEIIEEAKPKKAIETAMLEPATEKAVMPNPKPRTGQVEKKRVTK